MIFGISPQALMSQLLVGLINGSFYAMLSLGLAIIFGLLNIVNFAHGALYTLGAFVAWFLLEYAGIGYWGALILSPLVVGLVGAVIERTMLKRLHGLDPLYGLLLTFGLALIIQGLFLNAYGSSGLPYSIPEALSGGRDLGFMFLPNSRAWVIVFSVAVCFVPWSVPERDRHVVRDRADSARLGFARRHREPQSGASLWRQRSLDDHNHLCDRRGARSAGRSDG